MFSKKSGLGTKPKNTTDQDIHKIITERQTIFGEIQGMENEYIKKNIKLNEQILDSVDNAQEQQSLQQKFSKESTEIESKIREKIKKIIQLNKKMLDSVNNAQKQQSLKGIFSKELNEFEDRFKFISGKFVEPYGKNTNPPQETGGKSRRRRAKSSKRTKRSKARKSGKKSSKRSARKTRRSRRKH